MNQSKVKLDSNKLNKLINRANHLVKLLYLLFCAGIILSLIIVIKELHIISFILGIINVLSPIIFGFIIAWFFNPLVYKLMHKGLPKIISILIIYLVIFFFIFIFFKIFIPVLYKQINDLIKLFPNIYSSFSNFLDKLCLRFNHDGININQYKNNILSAINSYFSNFSKNIPKHIVFVTKSFFSTIGSLLMGLVVGMYFLIDYDHLYNKCFYLLPNKYCSKFKVLFKNISEEVRKTINGTLLVALMVLVCDTIAFAILGLDSPLLFGTLCGLTDLIPFIGPYIGGAAAVVVGFTESIPLGIGVLITCVIVQIVENYVLQPIVMSKATKVNPIIIISSLLLFGHFFGILGMIVASPIIALLKVIYDYICKSKFKILKRT